MARAGKLFLTCKVACWITRSLLLFALASRHTHAQTAPSENQPTTQLKVESNLVTVRVVVRDAHGQPIEGLTKNDFRLLDRGKEQSISHFEALSSNEALLPNSSPEQAQSPSSQRYLALYFDNIDITDAEIIQARQAADSYVTKNLSSSDHVAIFDSEEMLSDFTTDREKLHAALASLRRSPRAPQRMTQCPQISPYQALAILQDDGPALSLALEQGRHCIVGSSDSDSSQKFLLRRIMALAHEVAENASTQARVNLQMLEAITKAVAQAPGQRVVIFASPGFLSESEQNQLDRILDIALRSQVIINSLDPKGLANLMRSLDASRDDVATTNQRANVAIDSLDSAQNFAASDVLVELAQGSGGQFFHNDNDLKAGFGMLAGHPLEYILAFAPKDLKHDGKFHQIKVSLREKQKGATLQARRGYFAPSGEQAASVGLPERPAASNTISRPQPVPQEQQAATQSAPAKAQSVLPPNRKTPTKLFSAFRVKRITVAQLERFLSDAHDQPDLQITAQLKGFELTECLDTPELVRLRKELPGPESQAALLALGDRSAFQPLPNSEIETDPPPGAGEQQMLITSAVDYLQKTIVRLPNLLATRQSALYVDRPARHSSVSFEPAEPLHYVRTSTSTVVYRNGREKADVSTPEPTPAGAAGRTHFKTRKPASNTSEGDLASSGQFGPVLATVLADATRGRLQWGYWQKTDHGNLAVFHYSVPRKSSHYNVQVSSTVFPGFAAYQIKDKPGFHGEITIDPADGNITRISIRADLPSDSLMGKADLSVEYGPVQLGGQTYICPLRSVVLITAYNSSTEPHGRALADFAEQDSASEQLATERMSDAPQTMLSDVVFRDYHLFGSEARIITGNAVPGNDKP